MYDSINVLASFLNLSENDLILWSDNSITLKHNDSFEYIVTRKERNCFMEFLGNHMGFNIYKN